MPLNKLGLRFELWQDLEKPRAIFEFMQPVREGAFRQLLAATAPAGLALDVAQAELPLVYFFKGKTAMTAPVPVDRVAQRHCAASTTY